MSGSWLQLVWLALALGMMLASLRAHQIGAKKALVMVLVWVSIFMVAGTIASWLVDRTAAPEPVAPAPDTDSVLT